MGGAGRLAAAVARFQLGAQAGELGLQGFVFPGLALQVGAGEGQALVEAFRGEQVGELFQLVVTALEVAKLDVAFGQQGLEQVVGVADADAQFRRQLPLGEVGPLFQQAQEVVVAGGVVVGARGGAHGREEAITLPHVGGGRKEGESGRL